MTYSFHGGAGLLLSAALLRQVPWGGMEECVQSHWLPGGDSFLTACAWEVRSAPARERWCGAHAQGREAVCCRLALCSPTPIPCTSSIGWTASSTPHQQVCAPSSELACWCTQACPRLPSPQACSQTRILWTRWALSWASCCRSQQVSVLSSITCKPQPCRSS